MIRKVGGRDAAVAGSAVSEVVSASLSADSTLLAVELFLARVVIPEIADAAEVVAKLETAALALG